jgi:hypothetical protein
MQCHVSMSSFGADIRYLTLKAATKTKIKFLDDLFSFMILSRISSHIITNSKKQSP